MTLLLLHLGIMVVAFLIMLNGSLYGRAKSTTDAVLGTLWVILLLTVWLFVGWKSGLVALGLSFLYAATSGPLARATAKWLLSHPPR